jgi:hypothetical protein
MSNHLRKALEMLHAARPASGFHPETTEEWNRLLRAHEEMGYAMYREAGMPKDKARELARITHGGPAGRLLLMMQFEERQHD